MRTKAPSRRRVLRVLAAAAALPLLPGCGRVPLVEWRGQALGAPACLLLAHDDGARARRAVLACLDEIARLERIFSLFLAESELCRLNRDGRLAAASLDLRLVLAAAARVSAASGGAFDVTVQPLWRALARHFEAHPGAVSGPDAASMARALARVGHDDLTVDGAAVGFRRPGMAATLNGIAQGYVTDRLAVLLRGLGFERVLIEAGEIYALAPADGSAPWPVGLAGAPGAGVSARLRLSNRAVATSSAAGTVFEPTGRYNHLLDPRTGASARRYASVSVTAESALLADALSTALSLLEVAAMPRVLAAVPSAAASVVLPGGRRIAVTA